MFKFLKELPVLGKPDKQGIKHYQHISAKFHYLHL